MIRQGDILIVPVEGSALREYTRDKGKRVARQRNVGHVVAEGEATGHHHRIATKGVKMFEKDGTLYLEVPKGGAELVHEEHSTLKVPAGVHAVRRQREYVAPRPNRVATSRRVWD